MQSADGAINIDIGQSKSQSNICGFIVTPVLWTNVGENVEIVSPTPVATQDIDITGTQNIDQSNTCDDDNRSECLNEAVDQPFGFGNRFVLGHNRGAGLSVSVDSFEQDINQANTCLLFHLCFNTGRNTFSISPENIFNIPGPPTDVDVGSSIQETSQLNDCDGTVEPQPVCSNLGENSLGLGRVLGELNKAEISLGDNSQSVEQENNCDIGNVFLRNLRRAYMDLGVG